MPSERFDLFLDLIQTSIAELAHEYNKFPQALIRRLIRYSERVKGETRTYIEEAPLDKSRTRRFVLDMIGKVEYVEKIYFKESDGRLLYHELIGGTQYALSQAGNINELFAFYIYHNIQEIKKYYKSQVPDSFTEPKRKTNIVSFTVHDPSVLNDAFSQLKHFGYIPDNFPQKDFVDNFTGRIAEQRIEWLKDNNALAYLIRRLIEEEAVTPMGRDHWLVTKKCFNIHDRPDYDTNSLRSSDPPEDPKNLELIIGTFSHPISL